MQYAFGVDPSNSSACKCVTNYFFNHEIDACVLDPIVNNTVSTNASNLTICEANFIFNQTASMCQINCSALQYATGVPVPNTIN